MAFWIVAIIMMVTGLMGGIVNYLLPSNEEPTKKTRIRTCTHCIALGIGATLLVPIFLEIAQSKLLDNIHMNFSWRMTGCDCDKPDSAQHALQSNSVAGAPSNPVQPAEKQEPKLPAYCGSCEVPIKNYLLYAAYCFLAASAGFRFINSITDSVLKDRKIAELESTNAKSNLEKEKAVAEKEKAEKEKETVEKEKEKVAANNKIRNYREESQLRGHSESMMSSSIGPITVPNDPQKGRFGGKSTSNNRVLKATVTESFIPDFFNVTVWLESTSPEYPLTSEVIFYLHDSFSPSVVRIAPPFAGGRAVNDQIIAYGAFTVGAVTDNGNTMLELDLAEQPEFPAKFRAR